MNLFKTIKIWDVFKLKWTFWYDAIILWKFENWEYRYLILWKYTWNNQNFQNIELEIVNFNLKIIELEEATFLKHINQNEDFIDKKWNILRNWINFKDKDCPEDDNIDWIVTISKNLWKEGEISYSKEEFKSDCEIQSDIVKKELKEIEIEKEKIIEKESFLRKIVNFLN